jgi:Uma2 family endonuclease
VVVGGLGKVRPNVNISDRDEGWTENYRGPDVAVFLHGTKAVNRKTHWVGGPDFAIEILSEGDRAREKLDFYAKVRVRELLLIDRDPWRLELYRLALRRLGLMGTSTPKEGKALPSRVLPLTFRLVADRPRPTIEVVNADGRRWET